MAPVTVTTEPTGRVHLSQTPAAIRERNQRRIRANSRRGHIEFTAPSEEEKVDLMSKISAIRCHLGERTTNKVSNYEALVEVINFFENWSSYRCAW